MQITKRVLDTIERCYCTSTLTIDGKLWLVLSGEAIGGPCYAYACEEGFRKEIVWESAGGTMSIVQIPDTNGEFVAVQNFFPGFNSADAKLVKGRRLSNGTWHVEDLVSLPYVHRFDMFSIGGRVCILACVLCAAKANREDWSSPGCVAVGWLPDRKGEVPEFTPVLTGLTKNHGYYRNGENAYVACEEGVFRFTAPKECNAQWTVDRILTCPVSDIALCDLDEDGQDELITIEPFHGNSIKVYHLNKSGYHPVYQYPTAISFAHAIVGCSLAGKPCVVCGIRREEAELSILRCVDPAGGGYEVEIVEKGVGPSNVAVAHLNNTDIILSANHTKNEGAVYIVTPE